MDRLSRSLTWWLAALIGVSLVWTQVLPLRAGGVVGNGTPASCTNNALAAAIQSGGLVTFDCGPAPHTLIADTAVIDRPVTLDGGGLITLDGEGARQLFFIQSTGALTLTRLTLAQGSFLGNGGAIYNEGGQLRLEHVTIRDSHAEGAAAVGGAIYNAGGVVSIFGGQLLNNLADQRAGAIFNDSDGHVTLDATILAGNQGQVAGALDNQGTMTLTHTLVRDNLAITDFGGGIVADSGDLTVRNSLITGNYAANLGGGVAVIGSRVLIEQTGILSNTAAWGGGGLYINPNFAAVVLLRDGRVAYNRTTEQDAPSNQLNVFGGGIYNGATLTLERVEVSHNRSSLGGGLFTYSIGVLTVADSAFHANHATNAGGGLMVEGTRQQLTNVTISGNTADGYGGGLLNDSPTGVLHATFMGNQALQGASIYSRSPLTLTNSLLQQAATGANCPTDTVYGTPVPISSGGGNLADDDSCALFGAGDQESVAALLGPLADNGGPTRTHLPAANSPALDAANGAACAAADQRGEARPAGAGCDAGAVELTTPPVPLCGVYPATADATLDSAAPGTNAGAAATLGLQHKTGKTVAALLGFDLSSVPGDVLIQSAILAVDVAAPPTTLPYALAVADVTATWDEATVTWGTRPPTATVYSALDYALPYGTLAVDVTLLARQWAADPALPPALLLYPPGDADWEMALVSREGAAQQGRGPRLVLTCVPAPVEEPVVPPVAGLAQQAALGELTAASTEPLRLRLDQGVVADAGFRIAVPPAVGTDPAAQAVWFLAAYADALGVADGDDFQLLRASPDDRHYVFRQRHAGIPILAAEVIVHLDAGAVVGVSGNYVPGVALPSVPTLDAAQAEATALVGLEAVVSGDTQLRYVVPSLLGLPGDAQHLTWQVHVAPTTDPGKIETFYVDGFTGALVFRIPNFVDAYDLDLEDGNDQYPDQLCDWWDNDNIGANDAPPESANVAANMARVYNYWRNTFGRDSYDADGEQIEANIHVQFRPTAPGGPNNVNASYGVCDLFFFSRGTSTLDIVGHEFSHAVDEAEGQLIYANESGALDESFADIWGYYVDPTSFLLGEGSVFAGAPVAGVTGCSATRALRDLGNPPCYGQPDHVTAARSGDGRGQRASVPDPTAANDNGSVHTNSGIHNKVAALLIAGGTHNNYTVRALGRVKAERLFYNVFVNRLTSGSQFIHARDAAIAEALDLARRGVSGFNSDDVCSVRRAYASVGIGFNDRNCDGVDDAGQPDPDRDYIPVPQDNCPEIFNPFQTNTDGDSLGDDCDPDIDNDGRLNAADNCRFVVNPGQADWNNNGIGDACDDTDGDSVRDVRDNCRAVFNPRQENMDGDALGDACDPDIDGDGRANNADNCPVHRNPGQQDTTETRRGLPADGIGDDCDLCPDVSSADNTDLDGDRRANPCDDDDDGDGVLDGLDNCPLVANTDQFDWDNNGVGFVCDANEQRGFGDFLQDIGRRRVRIAPITEIPLPVCLQCVASTPPNRLEQVIQVELGTPFKSAIVDSTGNVVAKGVGSNLNQTLNFRPRLAVRPLLARTAADGAVDLPYSSVPTADEVRYYLWIIAEPSTDFSQEYDLGVGLEETVAPPPPQTLYLPLVDR